MTSSKNDKIKPKKTVTPSDEDIPEDVAKVKAKLEKETGKKYKYRPAKKDLPSIQHMLAHGAPESQGKPKTWLDILSFPMLLVVLFIISWAIFQMAPHELSVGRKIHKFRLPSMNKGGAATQKDKSEL